MIYLFILEVCFCNVQDISDGLKSQCQGYSIRVKVKMSSAFEIST